MSSDMEQKAQEQIEGGISENDRLRAELADALARVGELTRALREVREEHRKALNEACSQIFALLPSKEKQGMNRLKFIYDKTESLLGSSLPTPDAACDGTEEAIRARKSKEGE